MRNTRRRRTVRRRSKIVYQDQVHMGTLAFVMAAHVNGVSALHSDLMQRDGVCGSGPAVSEPDFEPDERGHAAPLDPAVRTLRCRA